MKYKTYLSLTFFFFQLQFLFAVEPFHFAFITDIHLSDDTTTVNNLISCVNQINHTDSIDFAIVAGDITEKGDTVLLRKSRNILDKLNVKYYIVPGNHETKLLPNGLSDFLSTFGSDKFQFEHKGIFFLGINTAPAKNSNIGTISDADLNWLKKQLKKNGTKKPVMLVTHYPLQAGNVENINKISELLRKYPIATLLTGHYHRNAIFSLDGIPVVVNRSLLRNTSQTCGYSIYEVTKNTLKIFEKPLNDEKSEWGELPLK